MDPNWAEHVTAIATAVLALGVFGAVAAALFAAQQVREARQTREAQTTAEFFRRWNEESLIESRRLVSSYRTPDELASAFQRFVSSNSPDAYTLYRELDFFEQLAALERAGAVDTTLIRQLVGRTLADRWDMWEPALQAVHGEEVYPLFRDLAARMRRELGPGAGPRLG